MIRSRTKRERMNEEAIISRSSDIDMHEPELGVVVVTEGLVVVVVVSVPEHVDGSNTPTCTQTLGMNKESILIMNSRSSWDTNHV